MTDDVTYTTSPLGLVAIAAALLGTVAMLLGAALFVHWLTATGLVLYTIALIASLIVPPVEKYRQ